MKQFALVCFLLFFTTSIAQSINSYIEEGIEFHDSKDYDSAINSYKKALEIEPKSSLANYEISLSYFFKGDYKNAIKHSEIVIDNGNEHLIPAYLTMGSSLDNMGRTKESIKLFKKGIRKLGDDYLLHYNLALNYFKLKDHENTKKHAIEAIKNESGHSSSHLLLAYSNLAEDKKIESFLSLNYFLLLEPNSERSVQAYQFLQKTIYGNVSKDQNKENSINISLSSVGLESDFPGADLMLSLTIAKNHTEENEGKSAEELFVENTDSFFTYLGEIKENKDKGGIYYDFYIPFFYSLSKSDHIEAYCYHISERGNPVAAEWITNNTVKLFEFEKWLSE
tara:strand:+ start:6018 stop:7028 length:1011 start_codon:yes stop_codon:yes gene_type:complete